MLVLAPAALLLLVCCVPQLQQLVRTRIRPWLVREVARQLSLTVWLQGLPWAQGPLLDTVARWSAATVSVEFYITALPLLHMAGYPRVPLLVLCLSISCYVGCALKDVLCGPRPFHFSRSAWCRQSQGSSKQNGISNGSNHTASSPEDGPSPKHVAIAQQIQLLGKGMAEFGAPSTHTLLALVMNGVIVSTLLHPTYVSTATATGSERFAELSTTRLAAAVSQGLGEHANEVLYGFTVAWAAWVGYTRMHLGVHSLIDCILGSMVGITLLAALVPLAPAWETWLLDGGLGSCGIMLLLHAAALALYPKSPIYTSTFQDVATFMGAHMGTCFGSVIHWGRHVSNRSVNYVLQTVSHLIDGQQLQDHLTLYQIEWLAAKILLGLLLVMLVLNLTKRVILAGLPPLLQRVPWGLRKLWQPPVSCDFTEIDCWAGVVSSSWFAEQKHQGQRSISHSSMDDAVDGLLVDGKATIYTGGSAGVMSTQAGLRHRMPGAKSEDCMSQESYVGNGSGSVGQRQSPEVPCRRDGLPWDVDVFRRYVSYALAVFAMMQFSAAADVAQGLLMQAAVLNSQKQ